MKKMTLNAKIAVSVLASALVLSSVGAIAAETPSSAKYTKDQAKQIALDHFGITETDITRTNYEFDDGRHEFEFTAEGIRYECDVHDLTGNVVDSELKSKLLDNTIVNNYVKNNGYISGEEAKKLALDKFGIASDAEITDYEIELDDDDYEVEFSADGVKYECDVNAVTGKIIYFKSRNQNLVSATQSTKGAAKSLALEHFGIADDADVRGMSVDIDDDRYEIEFYVDGVEYDCDINMYTNTVVKSEINDVNTAGIASTDPTANDTPAVPADSVSSAVSTVPPAETKAAETAPAVSGKLTQEEALQIALSALGITVDDYTRVEVDLDDGEYEFEFEGKGMEYECDVNAFTGTVHDVKSERDD